jgi:DNA-directed RNA polymerase specialized sigma24 family protein
MPPVDDPDGVSAPRKSPRKPPLQEREGPVSSGRPMGRSVDVEAVLRAAHRGESWACAALLEHARHDLAVPLARIARSWRDSEKDAGDLLHEVVLAALRGLSSLREVSYPVFLAWCTETARNQLRSESRARRRRVRRHEQKAQMVAEAAAAVVPAAGAVAATADLGGLPASQRSAFVLREGLELAWGTIGFVLAGRPGDAARQLHGRARVRLARSPRG